MDTAKNPCGLWARRRAGDKPHYVFSTILTLTSLGWAYSTVCLPQSMERGQDFNKVSSVSIYVSFHSYLKEKKRRKREEAKKKENISLPFTVAPG